MSSGNETLVDASVLCQPDGSDNLIGLPCSSSIIGNLFLMAVYGSLLAYGAERISTGSEKLLEVWGPGLVGGLLLPVLGALPDAMVIAISVLKATDPARLQEDLNVGMGTLVGSNVVLLTIPWAMTVALGNVQIGQRGLAKFRAHHIREQRKRESALHESSGGRGGGDGGALGYSSSSLSSGDSSSSDSSDNSSSSSSSSSDSSSGDDAVLTGESIKIDLGQRTQRRMEVRKRRRMKRRRLRKRGLDTRTKAARRRDRAEKRRDMLQSREAKEDGAHNLSSIEELDHDADVESHHEDDHDHDGSGPSLEMTPIEASVKSKVDSSSGGADLNVEKGNDLSQADILEDGIADEQLPKLDRFKRCFSYKFWFTHGVSVYRDTPITAWFLIASLLPFFIVQGVAFSGDKDTTKYGAIAALVICLFFFGIYSGYQIRNDKVQSWKQKQVKKKFDALRWVAMAKKVADYELSSNKSDAAVARNGDTRLRGSSSSDHMANSNAPNDAHIKWARKKLGLEEQLTAGFLKFRSQDTTSRAVKETIKTQKMQRRASRMSMSKHSIQWLENQKRSVLAKKNSFQPSRTLKLDKSVLNNIEEGSANVDCMEADAGPLDRQSTIDVLLGKDQPSKAELSGTEGRTRSIVDGETKLSAPEQNNTDDAAQRSMTRGASEFTLKDVDFRKSADYTNDAQIVNVRQRRNSESIPSKTPRLNNGNDSTRMATSSRSLLYTTNRRSAREDPNTLIMHRSLRVMKRRGANKQVSSQHKYKLLFTDDVSTF